MTCIVGIEHEGIVWLGGDSGCAIDENRIDICEDPKVAKRSEFVYGISGESRFCQLMMHAFAAPKPPPKDADRDTLYTYLVTKFAPSLRKVFSADMRLRPQDDRFPAFEALVGFRGKLYQLDRSFAIERMRDGYSSIGSGHEVAIGALGATKRQTPQRRLQTALELAVQHTLYVRPPFSYVRS